MAGEAYKPLPVPPQYQADHLERELFRLANHINGLAIFNQVTDTAWAGVNLTTQPVIAPGVSLTNFTSNLFTPRGVTTNLPAGQVVVPAAYLGGFQVNILLAFQAVSAGGSFGFTMLANGGSSGLQGVADLSNQSDVGNVAMVGFFPLNDSYTGDVTLTVNFNAASSKNITILGFTWTIMRTNVPPGLFT